MYLLVPAQTLSMPAAPVVCLHECHYCHFSQVQDKKLTDAEVAQKIKRRLKDANVNVSYGEIARAAMAEKRLSLAADVCGA